MADMSNYCKAYAAADIRAFSGWAGQPIPESGYVFLHDDFVVTLGAYRDEDILLDAPAPEWIRFCEQALQFAVPADVLAANAAAV